MCHVPQLSRQAAQLVARQVQMDQGGEGGDVRRDTLEGREGKKGLNEEGQGTCAHVGREKRG